MGTSYWALASELGTETVDRWVRQSKKKSRDSYKGRNKYKYPFKHCPSCGQLLVCGTDSYRKGHHVESCF